ncbi:hypothetical protein ONE63_011549 [Megalurothrips usitatus]|uniref:Uncharacterized protein n=1 Tax=Megalurothrips usitatus TaxID=439358 RepID=A0AAV7WZ09_9NEOP|nr:hypothetical protein ONE63_011549 [Megalurothrips usitatus]
MLQSDQVYVSFSSNNIQLIIISCQENCHLSSMESVPWLLHGLLLTFAPCGRTGSMCLPCFPVDMERYRILISAMDLSYPSIWKIFCPNSVDSKPNEGDIVVICDEGGASPEQWCKDYVPSIKLRMWEWQSEPHLFSSLLSRIYNTSHQLMKTNSVV